MRSPSAGGGALLGALVGGLLGNSVGGGMGRAAATGLGLVAGAAIGDQVESANNPPQNATVRNCQVSSTWQQQTVGHDVVYDYHGERYSTRLTQAPGAQIALIVNLTPADASTLVAAAPAPVDDPAPDHATAAPVYNHATPACGHVPPVVSILPQVVIGLGWGGGWGGRRGHWH